MPADSPGMADDSEMSETQPVSLINHDGTLTGFDY
jgi:hypothetical protein